MKHTTTWSHGNHYRSFNMCCSLFDGYAFLFYSPSQYSKSESDVKLERFYFLTTDSFKRWNTWRHHRLGESSPRPQGGRRAGGGALGSTSQGEKPCPLRPHWPFLWAFLMMAFLNSVTRGVWLFSEVMKPP